ncbi:hypothetical protein [Nioella sp.]|uniref:hypothetical protein n=1 Tax=Nioella sp. TaxID=1912091 RepID=UPI003A893773
MPLGLFVVISTFVVGIGTAYITVRRNPGYRQALRDWKTLKDPFGLRAWRQYFWLRLLPIGAALAWMILWVLIIEILRWMNA